MNSKELLEQATAKAKQLSDLAKNISRIEEVLPEIRDNALFINSYDIASRFGIETAERISQDILLVLITAKNEKTTELEQLLGIQPVPEKRKPATNNPEFEAATKDMFDAVRKPEQAIINPEFENAAQEMDQQNKQPDPVEDKMTEIIQKQEQEIKSTPLPGPTEPGYNPKKGVHPRRLPEAMTVEEVTRLRYKEHKSPKEIAEHFGIKTSAVSNFIFNHDIAHGRSKKADKQPEETERP
jgi:DNA-binding transcriptional regulator YiaG